MVAPKGQVAWHTDRAALVRRQAGHVGRRRRAGTGRGRQTPAQVRSRQRGLPGKRAPQTLLDRMAEAQVARARGEAMPNEKGTVAWWLTHWLAEVAPASGNGPADAGELQLGG